MPLISSFGLLNALNLGLDANKGGGGGGASNKTLIVAHNVSPYITAYPFDGGFGAKYANPASIPTATNGQANSVTFNTAGNLVAVAYSGSPNVSVYNWTAGVGFGSVFSQPATLPTGDGFGVDFNTTNTYITVSHNTAPYISTYAWSGGFGSKVANPSTALTSKGNYVAFSPAGDIIVVATESTPFINAYPFSSGSYGTKFANPSVGPVGTGYSVNFNKSKTASPYQVILSSGGGAPGISVYSIYTTGWGERYSDPSTTPGSTSTSKFSYSGENIVFNTFSSPFIKVYPWNNGFGTGYTNPSTALPGTFNGEYSFNVAGITIAAALEVSPFITAYSFTSGVGFGSKLANPTITPTGSGRGVAFSPNS